ncbi:MAG: response regulator [Azonexus sp.]|nr:response regulator [Azonexus sp.]
MSNRPWRILVADDDPTAALLFPAALAGGEFELTLVDNGLDALAAFRRQAFDMALLDVEMPGLDGMAVCAAIRQSHGDAFPVLLVTGRHDAEFLARAQSLAAGHLGKPVAWAALASMLRSRLARPPG